MPFKTEFTIPSQVESEFQKAYEKGMPKTK